MQTTFRTFLRTLMVAVVVLLGWQQNVQAQDFQVTVIPKTTNFPSTATAYSEDPTRIFNVLITNNSGTSQEVSFSLDLGLDYGNGLNYSLYTTEKKVAPTVSLSPGEVYRIDTREKFSFLFDGRLGTNVKETGLATILQMPEGNYHVCVRVHRKSTTSALGPQIGEGCYNFTVCYSGSAPELITPLSSVASTNTTLPATGRLAGTVKTKTPVVTNRVSASRLSNVRLANLPEGVELVTPTRYVNFRWTPVVTNCSGSSRFKYNLKIVKVLPNQNINDAIKNNPTVFSTTATSTSFIYDTVKNAGTPFMRGATYACQVKAVPTNGSNRLVLGNDGASQVIAFAWGLPKYSTEVTSGNGNSNNNIAESSNMDEIKAAIRPHYLYSPIKDESIINSLTTKFASEKSLVPEAEGKVIRTEDDGMKVLDPTGKKFEAKWMPVRHDSVMGVNYTVSLYEWLGSEAVTLSHSPLKTKKIDAKLGAEYALSNTTPVEFKDSIWDTIFEFGKKYYFKVDAVAAFHYAKMKVTSTEHFVDGILADSEHDTIRTREIGSADYSTSLTFQWGLDSSLLDRVTPAQFIYPVNLTSADVEDTSYNYLGQSIPQVPMEKGFEFIWKEAKDFSVKDTATYDLFVWKLAKGKDLKDIVKGEPYRKLEGIKDVKTADTAIVDSLKVGETYVARILTKIKSITGTSYKMLNEGYSHPIAFKLIKEPELDSLLFMEGACYAGDTVGLSKEIITPKVDELINNRVKIKMGRFNMVIQKATLKDSKYSGEGYVEWSPTSLIGCGIKVKFQNVKINKDYKVVEGYARSSATDSNNYINLNMGDNKWGAGFDMGSDYAMPYINQLIGSLGSPDKNGETWDGYINKGANCVSQLTHSIIDGGNLNVGVLTTPIKIDSSLLGADAKNVSVAINDAYFSPTTAQMNLFAVYTSHEDNLYIPLLATNVCMAPDKFFADSTRTKLMVLQNYEYELADSYVLRVLCPSNLREVKDGTYIEFDSKGFKELNLAAELDFGYKNQPGNVLLAVDMQNNGMVKPSTPVKAHFDAKIKGWKDWTANVRMDAFAIVGCEDWTFVPTGKGILYDHSRTTTPKIVKFPKNYFGKKPSQGGSSKPGADGKSGGKQGGGDKNQEPNASWQGFYMDQFSVFLPTSVSNAFVDLAGEEAAKKDSIVVYNYGVNGQFKDSVAFVYPGSRINFSANNFIWDSLGISTTLSVNDLLSLETKNGGGWMFSIDTIGVAFTKSEFDYGMITGRVDLPLFSQKGGKGKPAGDLRYTCAINTDSLTFALKPITDTLKLDLFIADVNFTSSFFEIKHDFGGNTYKTEQEALTSYTYKNQDATTRINCELNGKITIDFHAFGKLPFSLPGIKFENMYLRNYTSQKVAVGKKDTVTSYKFNGTEFNIGNWSKASPQKYFLTSYDKPMDEVWDAMPENPSANPAPALASGSIGGFKYSIDNLEPIFESSEYSGYMKAGLKFGGSIGFSIGEDATGSQGASGSLGFQMWTNVRLSDFDLKGFDGRLDSVGVETNFGPLKVKGKVVHHADDPTFGDGWQGMLGVTVCNVIDCKMAAGFGKAKNTAGKEYDWWFLEGVAELQNSPAIAGPVTFTGFGGGFAYNMAPLNSCENIDARELRKAGTTGSFADRMVSSGMSFKPQYDSWLAKAGVALSLTGAETAMNADGILQLRISNKHFGGISLTVTANVLSDYDSKDKTSKSEMMKVGTFIDFTNNDEKYLFNFSASVEAKIDLSSLIKAAASSISQKIPCNIDYPFKGTSIGTFIEPTIKAAINYDTLKAKAESLKAEDVGKQAGFGSSATLQIPIDFYYCHYKNGNVGDVSGKKDEWFFAIGRPAYNERVMFKTSLSLGTVMNTSTTWTMYFMIGNYFPGGFQLPEIPTDVQNMLGSKYQKAQKQRDVTKFENVGGFAFGASFAADLHFSMLLYLDVKAYLGFDAALLNVNGQGCNGYSTIGKNGFYATGQVYAMLEGEAGLELNLGFWKGKLNLVSAGIGALLQGGGPSPTWAYGLLAFKASCLGGLVKINTSVDFELGTPCLPGTTDPLADVKLFQVVTPAYKSSSDAGKSSNIQEPYVIGQVVSNMPWGEDVVLCALEKNGKNKTSRKFRFVLDAGRSYANYVAYTNASGGAKSGGSKSGSSKINYTVSREDRTQFFFETNQGGFMPRSEYTMKLVARAFEFRRGDRVGDSDKSDKIENSKYNYYYYNLGYSGGSDFTSMDSVSCPNGNYSDFAKWKWRNPTFADKDKLNPRPYRKDTTFYFNTHPETEDLRNAVVYTWPYNGDPHVPCKEFYTDSRGKYHAYIYVGTNKNFLKNSGVDGKVVRPFFIIEGAGQGVNADAYACDYNYEWSSTTSLGKIDITLPDRYNYYVDNNKTGYKFCIKLLQIKQSDYTAALNAIKNAQDQIIKTVTKTEIQGRDVAKLRSKLNAKNASSSTSTSTSTSLLGAKSSKSSAKGTNLGSRTPSGSSTVLSGVKTGLVSGSTTTILSNAAKTAIITGMTVKSKETVDIEKIQLQEAVATYDTVGDTTMAYYRKIKSADYAAAYKVGKAVYNLYFSTSNSKTYYDLIQDSHMEDLITSYPIVTEGSKMNLMKATSSMIFKQDQTSRSWCQKVAYLFDKWQPNDPDLYRNDVILPPIMYFAFDMGPDEYGNKRNPYAIYHAYVDHLLDMNNDIRNTKAITGRTCQNSKRNDFSSGVKEFGTEAERNSLNQACLDGLVSNWSSATGWSGTEYMYDPNPPSSVGSMFLNRCGSRNLPKTYWCEYPVPTILKTKVYDQKVRVTSDVFDGNASGQYVKMAAGHTSYISNPWSSYSSKIEVTDYATAAMMEDVRRYNQFYQKIADYAYAIQLRGFSHQENNFNYLRKTTANKIQLEFDDFPLTFYKSVLSEWAMTYLSVHMYAYKNTKNPGTAGMPNDYLSRFSNVPNGLQNTHQYKYWLRNAAFLDGYLYSISKTKGFPSESYALDQYYPSQTWGGSRWYSRYAYVKNGIVKNDGKRFVSIIGDYTYGFTETVDYAKFKVQNNLEIIYFSPRSSSGINQLDYIAKQMTYGSTYNESFRVYASGRYCFNGKVGLNYIPRWTFDIPTKWNNQYQYYMGLFMPSADDDWIEKE